MVYSAALLRLLLLLPVAGLVGGAAGSPRHHGPAPIALESVAYRVHRMPAMTAFYSEAFGARFEEVNTGGIRSRFATVGSLTLKFVPIRDGVDFENFPVHQLGFSVPDVAAVIASAERHGGRVQDAPARTGGRLHAAVRDPDGNTIELYGPAAAESR
jgi:catechol 2,3-dioxygenase-like lactoylglutathione lyase family enzyme